MKWIVHDNGQVVHAFETSSEYTLDYTGYETAPVVLDSNIWQHVVDNPLGYTYKDGQVLPIKA